MPKIQIRASWPSIIFSSAATIKIVHLKLLKYLKHFKKVFWETTRYCTENIFNDQFIWNFISISSKPSNECGCCRNFYRQKSFLLFVCLFVCLFVWEFHLFINPPLQMSPNTFRWKLAKIKPFDLCLGYTSISASIKGLKWSRTYLD